MNDENRHWLQLSMEARKLSAQDIELLEHRLQIDLSNVDLRVQLFSFYSKQSGNDLKHKNAKQKLYEQVLWFIENRPAARGYLGQLLARTCFSFGPKKFPALREAWLEKVDAMPTDGTVIGNAASLMVWTDIERASELFVRAYKLQPSEGWLETFLIHYSSEMWSCPSRYKENVCWRIIDAGIRSLETEEEGGAPFLTCEYICDAALYLGRYDIVRWYAEMLRKWDQKKANAYLGLGGAKREPPEISNSTVAGQQTRIRTAKNCISACERTI